MVSRRARNQTIKGKREQNSAELNLPILTNEPVSEVEVKTVIPEVVEELSQEELEDRQRLELKVERAFFEAGSALRELRDQRLYRNTRKSFEEYCWDRFGFQRRHSYQLIEAASIFDNLCANGAHETLSTIKKILPTNERQVRPLTTGV